MRTLIEPAQAGGGGKEVNTDADMTRNLKVDSPRGCETLKPAAMINLGSTPQLVVVGSPVSEEQAAEILLRTSNLLFHCNDEAWTAMVELEIGVSDEARRNDVLMGELGVLRLGYLSNFRVASDDVWGPHGWVAWNGIVGCSGYNLSGEPTREELLRDWRLIAEAWPFPELCCQICPSDELGEGLAPAVEYVVAEGRVRMVNPVRDIRNVAPSGVTWGADQLLERIGREENDRGCTLEQVRWAVSLARKSMFGQ